MKKYISPLIVGIMLLSIIPVAAVVVFLSGDSCCNEDTRGTMASVNTSFLFFTLAASAVIHFIIRKIFTSLQTSISFIKAVILSWLIPGFFYIYGYLIISQIEF